MYIWLVVWNMWIIFPYIGNVIIPTDELIFFRGVGIPPTRYIRTYIYIYTSYLIHNSWMCIISVYVYMDVGQNGRPLMGPLKCECLV